ncbi:hypothetical protein NQ317_010385 [Molorchus minor]|uniref:Uncharacterized protein n=1 Tax=Molorchus minor TaxID=1323400 RepID=A0ABQ9IZ49_9CUCU|nr:hypothetical protein NQ317_010385 [Molorchus minor]
MDRKARAIDDFFIVKKLYGNGIPMLNNSRPVQRSPIETYFSRLVAILFQHSSFCEYIFQNVQSPPISKHQNVQSPNNQQETRSGHAVYTDLWVHQDSTNDSGIISKQNAIKENKIRTISSLIKAHYGEEWRKNEHSKFYKFLLDELEKTENEEEENICLKDLML